MFGFTFVRPLGAAADLAELEYVGALMQTHNFIHGDDFYETKQRLEQQFAEGERQIKQRRKRRKKRQRQHETETISGTTEQEQDNDEAHDDSTGLKTRVSNDVPSSSSSPSSNSSSSSSTLKVMQQRVQDEFHKLRISYQLRQDASMTSQDIAMYLMSRFGVVITPQAVQELLFQDFSTVPNVTDETNKNNDAPSDKASQTKRSGILHRMGTSVKSWWKGGKQDHPSSPSTSNPEDTFTAERPQSDESNHHHRDGHVSSLTTPSVPTQSTTLDVESSLTVQDPESPEDQQKVDPEREHAKRQAETLDLLEFVSLILIPILPSMMLPQPKDGKGDDGDDADRQRGGTNNCLAQILLDMILHDTLGITTTTTSSGRRSMYGSVMASGRSYRSSSVIGSAILNNIELDKNQAGGIYITKSILQEICRGLGEAQLADNDELLDEMLCIVQRHQPDNDSSVLATQDPPEATSEQSTSTSVLQPPGTPLTTIQEPSDSTVFKRRAVTFDDKDESVDKINENSRLILNGDIFAKALTEDILLAKDQRLQQTIATLYEEDLFDQYLQPEKKIDTPDQSASNKIISRLSIDRGSPSQRREKKDDPDVEANEDVNNETTVKEVASAGEESPKKSVATTTSGSIYRIGTASNLDFVVDTYRSRFLTFSSWVFFGMSFLTYYSGIGSFVPPPSCEHFTFRGDWATNLAAFGCAIMYEITRWFYYVAVMAVYGIVYFGLVTIGNGRSSEVSKNRPIFPLLGALAAAAFTIVPAFIPAFRTGDEQTDVFLMTSTTIFGAFTIILNLWTALVMFLEIDGSSRYHWWTSLGSPRKERLIKEAGITKTDNIVANAIALHTVKDESCAVDSHLGQALYNFANRDCCKYEQVGGLLYTMRNIWNGEIFALEGVWFSGRLLSINIAQYVLAIFIIVIGCLVTLSMTQHNFQSSHWDDLTNYVNNLFPTYGVTISFESATDILLREEQIINDIAGKVTNVTSDVFADLSMAGYLPCPAINQTTADVLAECRSGNLDSCVKAGGSWVCGLVAFRLLKDATSWNQTVQKIEDAFLRKIGLDIESITNATIDWLEKRTQQLASDAYPSDPYMMYIPSGFGTFVAFLTCLVLAWSVVPSMTTIVLKLRCGVIPYMRDPNGRLLRNNPDQVTYLWGSMFWGTLLASLLLGGLVGGILFLVLYQNTSYIAQRILAIIIGLVIVYGGLIMFSLAIRRFTSQALYRKRPRFANIVLVGRECAFIGLSVWFTISRIAKLLLTMIMFVGRLDIPLLAPGVGSFDEWGFQIDSHPRMFLVDILQHEAHRHPYIELFGSICLLKLKRGDSFVTKAGTAWRILALRMLMPWLAKYRNLTRTGKSTYRYNLTYESENGDSDSDIDDESDDGDYELAFRHLRKKFHRSVNRKSRDLLQRSGSGRLDRLSGVNEPLQVDGQHSQAASAVIKDLEWQVRVLKKQVMLLKASKQHRERSRSQIGVKAEF